MTSTAPEQTYEPPALDVLGPLTSLAEGAGPGGRLIVMQTGPFMPGDPHGDPDTEN